MLFFGVNDFGVSLLGILVLLFGIYTGRSPMGFGIYFLEFLLKGKENK
jgi:hypothetical protein